MWQLVKLNTLLKTDFLLHFLVFQARTTQKMLHLTFACNEAGELEVKFGCCRALSPGTSFLQNGTETTIAKR